MFFLVILLLILLLYLYYYYFVLLCVIVAVVLLQVWSPTLAVTASSPGKSSGSQCFAKIVPTVFNMAEGHSGAASLWIPWDPAEKHERGWRLWCGPVFHGFFQAERKETDARAGGDCYTFKSPGSVFQLLATNNFVFYIFFLPLESSEPGSCRKWQGCKGVVVGKFFRGGIRTSEGPWQSRLARSWSGSGSSVSAGTTRLKSATSAGGRGGPGSYEPSTIVTATIPTWR